MAVQPSDEEEYKRAIEALNGLQTKPGAGRKKPARPSLSKNKKMYQFFTRVGLAIDDLNQLRAIHVAGTKGKGSTCALCESILRAHGLKTGFYSSPHLLEVRERIRINGRPLEKAAFASYFWNVFDKLNDSKEKYNDSMLVYFRFLTVMAFTVFLQEKVDVAVVEVGVGGADDSTNLIPQPVVCAITSLGYDHMDKLGNTLSEIAWHKAGIFKEGRPALTLQQPPEAMEVLKERAHELKVSSFQVVPPLSSYPGPQPVMSLQGKHQSDNASLAVQACRMWLEERSSSQVSAGPASPKIIGSEAEPFPIPDLFKQGLQQCVWAGRNQVFKHGNITYYLDGAHTPQSVEASAEWFSTETTTDAATKKPAIKILLFNITRGRDPKRYLPPLVDCCQFHYAIFCPNFVSTPDGDSPDQTFLCVTPERQISQCYANEEIFKELLRSDNSSHEENPSVKTKVFQCISHAIEWMKSLCDTPDSHLSTTSLTLSNPMPHSSPHIAVLVTGSLHLVGTVMSALGFTIDDV